jgi:hypothetical protein
VWFTVLFIACNIDNGKRMTDQNVITISISYLSCLPDVIRISRSFVKKCVHVGLLMVNCNGPRSVWTSSVIICVDMRSWHVD